MPKIDIAKAVGATPRACYPSRTASVTDGREKAALGNVAGLTQFGVNLTRLKPGAASALRHWHEQEDEFVYVLEGELVLIEDDGETVLGPGDARASRPASPTATSSSTGRNATRAISKSARARRPSACHYPDVDLVMERDAGGMRFLRTSGEPYPQEP